MRLPFSSKQYLRYIFCFCDLLYFLLLYFFYYFAYIVICYHYLFHMTMKIINLDHFIYINCSSPSKTNKTSIYLRIYSLYTSYMQQLFKKQRNTNITNKISYKIKVKNIIQYNYKNKPSQNPSNSPMQSQDQLQNSSQTSCIFCPQQCQPNTNKQSNLFNMMNQALAAKHISQSNNHLILPIDILLKIQDPNTAAQLQQYILYKQFVYVDQVQQNMRREYKKGQYEGKIKMLSQYYKFHKDIPHIVERKIQKCLAKYYDRKRQFDYKCIKRLLKEQQGLSITSVEDSVTQNSQTIQQKSRYSTLLNALQYNESGLTNPDKQQNKNRQPLSDSNVLVQICKEIGKAFPKTKLMDNDFKGSFCQNINQVNFQNYVKKQQVKKYHKTIKASQIQQHLKRKTKGIVQDKLKDNYFNFNKKSNNNNNYYQQQNQNQTIKKNDPTKPKTKRPQKQKQKADQHKKRFIYNTNIKIQIQNALFYPNQHHLPSQFVSGTSVGGARQQINVFSADNTGLKSRKSLVGKINAINQDRYRTPVSKIYQPHQTQASTRYRRKTTNFKKQKQKQKQRLRTKQSRQFKDNHYERQRQISVPKRVMSSHILKRPLLEPYRQINHNINVHSNHHPNTHSNNQNFKQKHFKHATISVAKLKLQNPKNDIRNQIRNRGSSVKRTGSTQDIRRRSITLTQNKNLIQKMAPLTKYSSSEIRDAKFKGISMKDLLTKKLNIYQR